MSRDVSEQFAALVYGSNTPIARADVWLGSEVLRAGALIISGNIRWDSRNAVEDDLSIVILDDQTQGSLLQDIIHSYGCRLNIRAGFEVNGEEELVSLGWFDITDTDAIEEWRWYDWRDDAVKISDVVTITAQGLMSIPAKSGLFSPTQPAPGSDAWTAIQSLCLDVVSVLDPGYAAKTLPSGNSAIVFDNDRLQAIQQIAALWDAKPIITDEAQLTLVQAGVGPVTSAYGIQINVAEWRNQTSSDNLHNGIVFAGQSPEGLELRGYWTEDSGPLFWGGPFGRRPAYRSSSLLTTQSQVDQAAITAGVTMKRARAATQTVKALWNPAQKIRDRPELQLPDRTVPSEIVAMTLPIPSGQMDVTLRLPLLLED